MTRAGTATGIVGSGILALGLTLGLAEITGLGIALIGLLACSVLAVTVRRPSWTCTRALRTFRPTAGSHVDVPVTVGWTGRGRAPDVELAEEIRGPGDRAFIVRRPVAALSPGGSHDVSYRLRVDRRGFCTIGPGAITWQDPFGLARRSVPVTDPVRVLVLPRIVPLAPPELRVAADTTATAARSLAPGSEFSSLRDYVAGDDLRKVHWRSSARRDELVVRDDEQPHRTGCTVVLDVDADIDDPAVFEQMVSAAASIIAAATRVGRPARLCTTAGFDSNRGIGRRHTEHVLGALAVIGPAGPARSTIVNHGRDPIVLLTAAPGATTIRRAAGSDGGPALTVVFGGVPRPDVPEAGSPKGGKVLRVGADDDFAVLWDRRMAAARSGSGPRIGVGSR